MTKLPILSILGVLALPHLAWPQVAELAPVVAKQASRAVDIPGEFMPFLSVSIHAKVRGYVERIPVDRGSVVKAGDLLAELSAPEMDSTIAEAESRVQSLEAELVQTQAQLSAAESTYEFLKKASGTTGAIAGNELIQAEKQVEATKALIRSRQQAVRAAQAAVDAEKKMQSYLRISAPFDGVVIDRLIHPGALVGPGADPVLLVLQQVSQLRLVAAVPEEYFGGIVNGTKVQFQVPAHPERTYTGTIARMSRALDQKTRTLAVELDVSNRDGSLAPGMYPTVKWPVSRSRPALFVPRTAVVTTTERIFVVRNRNGRAEWVSVRKGPIEGELMEVMGELKAGDMVVLRATDEVRDGSPLTSNAGR